MLSKGFHGYTIKCRSTKSADVVEVSVAIRRVEDEGTIRGVEDEGIT